MLIAYIYLATETSGVKNCNLLLTKASVETEDKNLFIFVLHTIIHKIAHFAFKLNEQYKKTANNSTWLVSG